MTEFERINAPRVEKILKMLDVIDKSATSNGVPSEEVTALLAPLIERIGGTPCDAAVQEPETRKPPLRPTTWIDVRHMAEAAPLRDLSMALAVYMNRVDEALADNDIE